MRLKKDTVYLLSFIAIVIIVFIVNFIHTFNLISISSKELLKVQIESSKREAQEIAQLVSLQLSSGIPRNEVIKNVQKSIEGVDTEFGFICMFDKDGQEICHPFPDMIGQQLKTEQSFITSLEHEKYDHEDLYNLLQNRTETGGIVNFSNKRPSEVLYLYPVKGADWVIAAHADLKILNQNLKTMRSNFIVNTSLSSVFIIIFCFFSSRFIGGKYERELEKSNALLTNKVIDLNDLKQKLDSYKEKIDNQELSKIDFLESSGSQQRILTYFKDELKAVEIKDIAYVYTEFKITYVVDFTGRKTIANISLDEAFKKLNSRFFFRANRQYLLSIQSIVRIVRYGKSQLKIQVIPDTEKDILINKNKVAEFKVWLNS